MLVGGLELHNNLCLAPLAGITTLPVREFFTHLGAGLTHTEMISCAGLVRDNAKTNEMLQLSKYESTCIIQLFAPDEVTLVGGAEASLRLGHEYSAFGINMACPMPKVTRNGSGAALLHKPEVATKMVSGLKSLGLPVWVKIRKLEDDNDTLKFIDGLVSAGADNVCIHGRTCAQRYEGTADRNILALSAKEFPGYISASGDVKTSDDINEYLSYGCVAVMLARGAISNPFLFEEYRGIFRTHEEKLRELIDFAIRARDFSGEHKAVVMLKRFAGCMLRYTRGSAELRRLAGQAVSIAELTEILGRGY